jgi:hypothetical protein
MCAAAQSTDGGSVSVCALSEEKRLQGRKVGLVREWHGLTSGTVFRQRQLQVATCCLRCLDGWVRRDNPRSFDQTELSAAVDQRCSNMNSHLQPLNRWPGTGKNDSL